MIGGLAPFGIGTLYFGSFRSLYAYIEGYPVVANLENVYVDESQNDFEFHLQNLTATPVTVVAVESGCSCVTATNVPLRIPPRASAPLQFRVTHKGATSNGLQVERILLHFDRKSPRFELTVQTTKTSREGPNEGRS